MLKGMGTAFVFINPRVPQTPLRGWAPGHLGWGFQLESGRFCFGSTENFDGSTTCSLSLCKTLFVRPGEQNYAWSNTGTYAEMVNAMLGHNPYGCTYEALKEVGVERPRPESALQIAQTLPARGYSLFGNNCLDHVRQVLAAYNAEPLPSALTYFIPRHWFSAMPGEMRRLEAPCVPA